MKQDSTGIPTLLSNGKEFNTAKGKAGVLNDHFQSVYTSEDLTNITSIGSSIPIMPSITLSTEEIEALLSKLDTNKTAGPDQIPSYILKHCAHEVAPILQVIYNQSLHSGQLPSDWLTANITPIFKKGNRSCPINYRPISLTSVCCKTLEHIIFHSIMEHLQNNNLLIDNQHGFRAGYSCQIQLILLVEDLLHAMDNHYQIDLILLDFTKTFDKVPHRCLLTKLSYFMVLVVMCTNGLKHG